MKMTVTTITMTMMIDDSDSDAELCKIYFVNDEFHTDVQNGNCLLQQNNIYCESTSAVYGTQTDNSMVGNSLCNEHQYMSKEAKAISKVLDCSSPELKQYDANKSLFKSGNIYVIDSLRDAKAIFQQKVSKKVSEFEKELRTWEQTFLS